MARRVRRTAAYPLSPEDSDKGHGKPTACARRHAGRAARACSSAPAQPPRPQRQPQPGRLTLPAPGRAARPPRPGRRAAAVVLLHRTALLPAQGARRAMARCPTQRRSWRAAAPQAARPSAPATAQALTMTLRSALGLVRSPEGCCGGRRPPLTCSRACWPDRPRAGRPARPWAQATRRREQAWAQARRARRQGRGSRLTRGARRTSHLCRRARCAPHAPPPTLGPPAPRRRRPRRAVRQRRAPPALASNPAPPPQRPRRRPDAGRCRLMERLTCSPLSAASAGRRAAEAEAQRRACQAACRTRTAAALRLPTASELGEPWPAWRQGRRRRPSLVPRALLLQWRQRMESWMALGRGGRRAPGPAGARRAPGQASCQGLGRAQGRRPAVRSTGAALARGGRPALRLRGSTQWGLPRPRRARLRACQRLSGPRAACRRACWRCRAPRRRGALRMGSSARRGR
jgi:hypothetical protein